MAQYTVQQGDCITKIARDNGLTSEKIWKHPSNAELKAKRKDCNVLFPGDVLYIPDKEPKTLSRPTDKRHKFVRKGVPAKLALRLVQNGTPRSNEPYVLVIDGDARSGRTDANGWIRQIIPPDAREGTLLLKGGQETYPLNLGHLNPVDQTTGVQARLKALGYYGGSVDGAESPQLSDAIRSYQAKRGLQQTGGADAATAAALKSDFGS
jgi:N-acetylmuramoyl-L-alanine amidase